jgi:hypothetical protein
MERFHHWLKALSSQVLPESRLGKAVHYTLGQWPKLTVFLSHGVVPVDKAMISYYTSCRVLEWGNQSLVH